MSTIDNFILCGSVGIAWAQAVALWEQWVTDNTKTISRGVGTALGCRTLLMQYVQGADTIKHHLAVADVVSTATAVPLSYVLSSPGWRAMPKLMLSVYGTTTTKTSFESVLRGLRSNVLETWCGTGTVTWTNVNPASGVTGLTYSHYRAILQVGTVMGLDEVMLGVNDGTMVATLLNDRLPSDGLMAGPASTGGSRAITDAQLDRIVTPLEDMSLNRYEVSMNHGAVNVTASNGSVIEP